MKNEKILMLMLCIPQYQELAEVYFIAFVIYYPSRRRYCFTTKFDLKSFERKVKFVIGDFDKDLVAFLTM